VTGSDNNTDNAPASIAPVVGTIVHATGAPGRIQSIGEAAITGKQLLDLHPYYGPVVHDQPLLAIDRVRYTGEAIALLAGDAAIPALETESLAPSATGAKRGDPALVHVTDLLEKGDAGGELTLETARTNLLLRQFAPGAASTSGHRSREITIARPLNDAHAPISATASWSAEEIVIGTSAPDHGEIRRELSSITGRALPEFRFESLPERHLSLPGAIGLEALALAASRFLNQPVRLQTSRAAFNWSGPRAWITWDSAGNARLIVDAGAVAGYLPLWLEEFARQVAERTVRGATVTAELVYSEHPPVAASKQEWVSAIGEALESSPS
jgi:hypothetical protein